MGIKVANNNFSLEATTLGGWLPGDPNSATDMSVIVDAVADEKADSAEILVDEITWTVIPLACSFAGHTHVSGSNNPIPSPGFNTGKAIEATAQYTKCEGKLVLREGDSGICNGSFTNNSSGATVPCQCTFKISDAGQSDVKAE